ncbi:hypothetical protein HOLleu_29903 [Holothuria leucospilota]|uniref:C-type lectin domain-containing protein n=1 Tax=Holothuria leucospilota TaxID=206669 RepID=A0A9Q1BJN2_HOLLE|nr:hypothetical protein HOLleu_29903 [Holothuria leucospilota]
MFTSWTVASLFIRTFTFFKICDSLNEPRCSELDPTNPFKWVSITPGRCVYGEYDITLTIGSNVILIKERERVPTWTDAVNFCPNDHPDAFLYITNTAENELDIMGLQDLVEAFGQNIALLGSEYVWQACYYTGSRWECLDHTEYNPHYWQSSSDFEGFWRWSGSQPSGTYASSGCLVLSLNTGLMEAHDCNDGSATSPLILCAVDFYNDTSTTTATEVTTGITTDRSTTHFNEATTDLTTNLVSKERNEVLSATMPTTTSTPAMKRTYLSTLMKTTEIVSPYHSKEPSTHPSILQRSTTTVLTTTSTQSTKTKESTQSVTTSPTFKMTTPMRIFTTKSTSSNFENINIYQSAVFKESNFIRATGELCPRSDQPKIPVESPLKCAILCVSEQVHCVSINFILRGTQKLCQLHYETGMPNEYHPPGECIFYPRK